MNKTLKRTDLVWLAFTGLAALVPLVPAIGGNSFIMHVLILVLLYASMAQAWNIIGGYCGQVSFGHSVFFGLGNSSLRWNQPASPWMSRAA